MVDHLIVGDAKEPRSERGTSPLKRGHRFQGFEKNLPGNILRLGHIPQPNQDVSVNLVEIFLIEGSEGIPVTASGPAHQALFIKHLTTPALAAAPSSAFNITHEQRKG